MTLGCYEQVMGEPGKCLVIGGGTYVHFLKMAWRLALPD